MYVYICMYKVWDISFHPFLRIRIFNNGGITVESQFTAFIEPPSAFLILRRRSGMESMRLCKRDKSTSSHNLRIAFFIPSSVVNFLLSSLSSRMAQRFSIGLMSSPLVGHSSTTATSCLSNQAFVDFAVWQVALSCCSSHPSFSSPNHSFAAGSSEFSKNVLVCACVESVFIENQVSLALPAESSPRINRQPPPLHLLPRNFTHRFGPDKVVSWVASFELFKLVFVTEHHIAPILLYVGPGELQPTALVSFRKS